MFFDDKPIEVSSPKGRPELRRLEYKKLDRSFATLAELRTMAAGSPVVFDIECFINYFLVAFKHLPTGKYFFLEQSPDQTLDIETLRWIVWHFKLIGFNSRLFDIVLIDAILRYQTIEQVKELANEIVLQDKRVYINTKFNHIDLIEVAPLQGSLKLYAARIHVKRVQEMPVNPFQPIQSREEADETREYCFNDLDCTEALFNELKTQIELREEMSKQYGDDLRSKSDAQIAEAVISSEFEKITGSRPKKNEDFSDVNFAYTPPAFMAFQTPLLQELFAKICRVNFVSSGGYVDLPPELERVVFRLGDVSYKLAMGGLHSIDENMSYRSNDEYTLRDRDVASYYPAIVLNNGMYPPRLGPTFTPIYQSLVTRRLEAKRAKQKTVSESLKITINGTFGKTGNPYSIVYSPEMLMFITLTGQLALLMLIEQATEHGIKIVSANTDGVLFYCHKEQTEALNMIVKWWETITRFETEETIYKAYYARDVNNYIAIKTDNEIKAKGAYSDRGTAQNSPLSKNPESFICCDAVKKFLVSGDHIDETIRACRDISRFVTVRNVKGGAHKDGVYLGKVIRWYYAKNTAGEINYISNGNKVPKSDGAKPLMELPDEFPTDIDYDRYERDALAILWDIAFYQRAKQGQLF